MKNVFFISIFRLIPIFILFTGICGFSMGKPETIPLSITTSAQEAVDALFLTGKFTPKNGPKTSPVVDAYFEIASIKTEPVYDPTPEAEIQTSFDCESESAQKSRETGGLLNPADISIGEIINAGKKAWEIISKGRPVVNLKQDVAHALPAGIHCWSDLEGWQPPRSKKWRSVYINKLGDKVIDFTYRVSFIPGGQYMEKGRYLIQATIVPAELFVAWGFDFNVQVSVPAVFNMGTRSDPVAGMQLNLKWILDTTMNRHEVEEQFFISGMGVFEKLEANFF